MEDSPSLRNCQNQKSHPSLSHIEQECRESLIQGKIHNQRNSKDDKVLESYVIHSLRSLNNMAISLSQKRGKNQKGSLCVHETPILRITFMILTDNSSVITNDTQRPQEYPHHQQ